MNKQRKVLITITYNEMGIIIDTKAEEVAQPNLQPTCNQLATDTISRQAAIDAASRGCKEWRGIFEEVVTELEQLPSAEPEIIRCRDCKHWDKTWSNNWSPDYHYCPVIDEVRKGNFHCRYAERRTDGVDS